MRSSSSSSSSSSKRADAAAAASISSTRQRVQASLLSPKAVLACCSAAVGLLLGAWAVLSVQYMHTQVWHIHRGHVEPLLPGSSSSTHNPVKRRASSTVENLQQRNAASNREQQQQQQQQQQRPAVNSLQLTVIQVADGSWRLQETAEGGSSSSSSGSSGSSGGGGGGSSSREDGRRHQQAPNEQKQEQGQLAGQQTSAHAGAAAGNSVSGHPRDVRGSFSNSSSNKGSRKKQPNTARKPAQPTHTAARVPKVALLFLVKDSIPNEPIWRAFFEAAAALQLQPHVAAAAAAAAQQTAAASVSDLLGNKPLHPKLEVYEPWIYPGFRIQHGLSPGAEPPPAKPQWSYSSWAQLQAALNATKGLHNSSSSSSSVQLQQQQLGRRGAAAGGANSLQPPAAAAAGSPWEQAALQQEMQRLLQLSQHQHDPQAASPDNQVTLKQQQQQQQQQGEASWDVKTQLATMHEALAYKAQLAQKPQPSSSSSSSSSSDSRRGPLHPLLSQQQLFSVYVHTPAGVLLPRCSIFSGAELAVRLNTTRGYAQHVLAEAEVLLLHAALGDAANTQFVLVSDSSMPLYPPDVIWAQLVSEPLSRLDACVDLRKDRQFYRWRPYMASAHFGPQHWRKSSQWFALSRPAAMLAVADTHVRELFHSFCYTNLTAGSPMCVSDEHYIASLMASYGLDSATDCQGLSHYADWSAGGWHPKGFKAAEITPALLHSMRAGRQPAGTSLGQAAACDAAAAARSAAVAIFQPPNGSLQPVMADGGTDEGGSSSSATAGAAAAAGKRSAGSGWGRHEQLLAIDRRQSSLQDTQQQKQQQQRQQDMEGDSSWLVAAGYAPLSWHCPLFGRKFAAAVVNQTLALALSCNGVGLGGWCRGSDVDVKEHSTA
uniref:Uncharacterized protein n=1 Tax=Tetradesmus obliquus TaxID=3088 RepID=A0A383V407_TETOB|eukprot:jgi/Sobl393_1/13619/SZX60335.1